MIGDTYDAFKPKDRGMFGENECGNDSEDSPTRAARSNLVDPVLRLLVVTEKGLCVNRLDAPLPKDVWLPRSLCEHEITSAFAAIVTMPRWLAKKTGLM